MGNLFKVLAATSPGIDTPYPFGMIMIAADALRLDGISHGFFTREGGHSAGLFASLNCGMGSGDDKETVLKNRAAGGRSLGVAPDRLLSAWQVHSADAVVVAGPWPDDERPRADAMVTRTPGLALGVLTADCGPVLFADAAGRRHRCRPCGLEGGAHRRHHPHARRDGRAGRRPRAASPPSSAP